MDANYLNNLETTELLEFLNLPMMIWDLETQDVLYRNSIVETMLDIEPALDINIGKLIKRPIVLKRIFKKLNYGQNSMVNNVLINSYAETEYVTNIFTQIINEEDYPHGLSIFFNIEDVSESYDVYLTDQQFEKAISRAPIPVILYTDDDEIILLSNAWEEKTGFSNWTNIPLSKWLDKHNIVPNNGSERINPTEEDFDIASVNGTYTIETKDGKELIWSFTSSKLDDLYDGRKLFISMIIDVTKQMRINDALGEEQQRLEASNRELEQFAYIASHDLQEPLRSISGYAQLIERQYNELLDDRGRKFINAMIRGTKKMREMIDDLLTYSRLRDTGKLDEDVKLGVVIRQVKLNLQSIIQETETTIEIADKLPTVKGKAIQLVQLFQNLIHNAIKFRKDNIKPHIVISMEEKNDRYIISVSDNGIGMNSKYLDKIFVMFTRLHSKSKYQGTGIGLAICKKIMNNHGGRISVDSEEGKGATFMLEFPKEEL